MSALEQYTPAPAERRIEPRIRVAFRIAAHIGRGDGTLVDLSLHGARVRHTCVAVRGSRLRLAFEWEADRFAATAEVLASRVVSIGGGATTFESRLRFLAFEGRSSELLSRVLDAIENYDLRRWVDNLHGWRNDARGDEQTRSSELVRYRLIGARWEKRVTHDAQQPPTGFVLPASVSEFEAAKLCDTYARSDDAGRELLRKMAAAVVGSPDGIP
ncbi:MAG TPA: PilZ domain-containing protein [Thermoanaerobaculia bacterium]|jgi:hypothetical protein